MKRFALATLFALIAVLSAVRVEAQTSIGNFSQVRLDGACKVDSGSGAPEGAVTGNVCDIYLRTNGGSGTTFCIKESGSGNTGWACVGTIPAASIAASKLVGTDIATVGTVTSGTWSATTIAVNKGGTGITSGTSGGVLAFTASGTIASSGALTVNLPVIGGGAGAAPGVGTRTGNTTQFATWTGVTTSGNCVQLDASGNLIASGDVCGGAGGGAPTSAQYVTLATNGTLSDERVLTAGQGITITDAGAGSTITVASTGWAQIGSPVVTSGSQATVDFTSIPATYSHLKVVWTAKDTTAGNSTSSVRLKVNNDGTSGNYTVTQRSIGSNGANVSTTDAAAATGGTVGNITNAGTTSQVGSGELIIHNYSGTTWFKTVNSQWSSWSITNNGQVGLSTFSWLSTAAINRLTFAAGTAFTDGSIFTLYGIK